MAVASVNGVALAYESDGQGEPLLLIPGAGMGMWCWFRQTPAIRRLARLITYDPRGVGGSYAHEGFQVANQARDAVGLLQVLGVERTAVVGLGSGGFIALQLALDRPEMVSRLVLVSTAASGDPATFLTKEALRLREETKDLTGEEQFRHDLGVMVAPGFTARNPGLLDSLLERYRESGVGSRESGVGSRDAFAEWRLRGSVAKGAAASGDSSLDAQNDKGTSTSQRHRDKGLPTLVIGGAEDRWQRAGSLEELAAEVTGARLERVPGAGHLPNIERPEVFNRLLMNFIFEDMYPSGAAVRGVER